MTGNLPKPIKKQREVLYMPATGHSAVLGTAGSGKTTIALYRAAYLSEPSMPHAGRTLLLTFNKISKGNFASQQRAPETVPSTEQTTPNQTQEVVQADRLNLGPKLPVQSIEKSVWFYREILGLTIKKQSRDVVVFYQGLVLAPASYAKEFQSQGFRSLLYVEVTDIQNRYHWIMEQGIQIITPLECWGQSKRRFFRCHDLDENLVEVFERQ